MVAVSAAAGPAVSNDLATILAGRDTRWYKGHLLKLTLALVRVTFKFFADG